MSTHTGFAAEERSFIRGEMLDFRTLRSLKNWYPVAFDDRGESLYWRDMGDQSFTESFFQNSLNAQAREQRRVCTTSVAALSHITDTVPPTAFIFHISRCGSTLLTQMLSHLTTCIVLSEPPVIDSFFRHYPEDTAENRVLFQQLIAALGQRRFAQERHYIIKFDSWHIAQLGMIRAVFPHTPCIFLYRAPQQVLASHQRQRGPQMIPDFIDMGRITIDRTGLLAGDLDGYCLRVLEQFYRHAIAQHQVQQLTLINYNELPKIMWEFLLDRLGIMLNETELKQLKARSQFHSKYPNQNYQGDPDIKVDHPLFQNTNALYQQLEKLRSGSQ